MIEVDHSDAPIPGYCQIANSFITDVPINASHQHRKNWQTPVNSTHGLRWISEDANLQVKISRADIEGLFPGQQYSNSPPFTPK